METVEEELLRSDEFGFDAPADEEDAAILSLAPLAIAGPLPFPFTWARE